MKQLYRIIIAFLLAIFGADVAYAQYEVAIEDELLQDTCLSYLTGLKYYNLGDEEFKEPSHDIASKMYFEMAVRSFEQHEKEHPQHDYTNLFLGQSYYYLTLLESHITTGVPEYNKKVNEYAQNALQHLPQDNTIMRFICYAISGLCFVDEQNDHDASNAFQEALNYNLDFSSNPILLYFYKRSLYQHSYLCYSSYLNNISYSINKCGSIQETPTLDTCSGDQQLEHCIDGLNRLVGIEQNESDRNQIDTSALVLLGECYYYKGEYEQAKRCYEKSGVSPEQLDIWAVDCFWHSYILIGINDERYEALFGQVIEAYRNNYALYHLLYRDVSDDKLFGKEDDSKDVDESLLKFVHTSLLYYIGKKEYNKALDFWLKIKNNFSLSPILLMDQAFSRMYLGDFSAISDFAYAYNLMNLRKVPEKDQLNNDVDPFKTIKDAYNEIALSALYIEKNYEDAKEYYSELEQPTPEENLMLGVCYKKLNKEEGAKQYFYEVIRMEDSIGKISETPYAYLFLGESDKAIESMEQMLKTGFPSKICNEDDNLNCFGIHYQAAEIYAKVGRLEKAKWHISKALEYYHDPWVLAMTLKMPLLDTIRDYIEQEVNQYRENLGISESKIHRDTIVCDISFKKSSDYTRTVKCKFQMNDSIKEIELLFDPGADKCQFNIHDANSLGITYNDIIACIPLNLANGEVVVRPVVSLNKVVIGDIELENVQAVIDSTSTAHSLLGCTALNNLKVEMPSPVNKGKMRFTYIKESIEIPEDKKNTDKNQGE